MFNVVHMFIKYLKCIMIERSATDNRFQTLEGVGLLILRRPKNCCIGVNWSLKIRVGRAVLFLFFVFRFCFSFLASQFPIKTVKPSANKRC